MKQLLIALGLLAASGPAFAESRIREIDYDDKSVVRIDGCIGFQTMIGFAHNERIENVGIGDAAQWLVVPNKRGDTLFVKPAFATSHSNMTVATDRRRYNFELSSKASEACRRGQVVYELRFRFPDEPPAEPAPEVAKPEAEEPPPEQRNLAYSFTGARENIPLRVFDNGQATYFRWAQGSSTPAVYAVGSDKSETPVSFVGRGDWLVVEAVAPSFVLRRGNNVSVLYNDAYQSPALDSGSPQPREEEKLAKTRMTWLFGSRKTGHAD